MFGYNLLYLINVKYFSLTTKFDVILNDVFVFLSFFICAIFFVKSEKRNIKKMIIPLFCMSLFSFSIIQGSSGAMETQVRIGMSLSPIYAAILSYIYNKEDRMNWKNILLIVVISIIYINIFGTLYSFAIIPFMFIAIIYAFIARDKHKFNYIFPFIVIILCCLLYMYEYGVFLFDKSNPGQTGGVFEGVILLFKNIGETFLSWFSYNAGGVFGFDFDLVEMKNTFLGVGIFISFLILVSIFLFFYKKINKKSWVPFLLIGYSIFVFVLTRIGRINSWQYYCAEWYIVHTKYQMVGIIWIISSYLFDKKKFSYVFSTLNFAVNFVLLLFLLVGNKIISDRLPHVAMYYEGKQTYLFYPINALFSVTMWKTVLFAGIIPIYVIMSMELILNTEEFFSKKKNVILYICIALLTFFLRNNGIYVVILTMPFILIVLRKYWKKVLIMFLATVVLYEVINTALMSAFNIKKGSIAEMLSIPLQQIARVEKYHRDELDEETIESINKAFKVENIGDLYNPILSDPVKAEFNDEYFAENKMDFIKLWLKLMKSYFKDYIESFISNSYGYYYPEATHWVANRTMESNNMGLEQNPIVNLGIVSKVDSLIERREIPIISMFFSIGIAFWAIVICLGYKILNKEYKYIIVYLPIFILWLTIVASPVFCEYRYAYPMFTVLPIFIALNFQSKK